MKAALALIMVMVTAVPVWAASNILNWKDNSSNEDGFVVQRKTEACAGTGAFTQIATVGMNIVTFTDVAVAEGSTYCYQVAANNAAGLSGFSNKAERTVPFSVPAAPSNLTVSPGP